MPARRSISFRKLMHRLSRSTEDLTGVGRYRSTENLYEFREEDEQGVHQQSNDNDVFEKNPEIRWPTVDELFEAYQTYLDNGRKYRLRSIEGWEGKTKDGEEVDKEEKQIVLDEEQLLEQYHHMGDILKEQGIIDVCFLISGDSTPCFNIYST
ncbi:uncharacterized protein [Clytia hemisphaerica]|uniref:uncharacterized protein n=1 Tax=Clytia hemisphaerica TaxID=252671 RepID=UPI0034D40256